MTDWFVENIFSSASIQHSNGNLLMHSGPVGYLVWGLAFAALFSGCLWCWRRGIGGRYAPGFFFASFVIPLIVIPGIAAESIAVDPGAISMGRGWLFYRYRDSVPLKNVERITEMKKSEEIVNR